MNLNEKIDDLFQVIKDSYEYQSYLDIVKVIEGNDEINELINDIKKLQQRSVKLEYSHNEEYKEIDKEVDKKISRLYAISLYKEYIIRMNQLNDILAESTFQIEKYINSKI